MAEDVLVSEATDDRRSRRTNSLRSSLCTLSLTVQRWSPVMAARVAARAEVQCVLFDFGAVNFIDVTASDELFGFIKQLENDHITVAFARVRDVVRDDMRLAGIEPLVGANSFHERITDGVTAWQRSRTPLSDRSAPAD